MAGRWDVSVGSTTLHLRGTVSDVDGNTLVTEVTEVTDAVPIETPVRRIAGDNRYATAAALAADTGYSPVVYLASGEAYPDALAVAGLAGAMHAPVLLTDPAGLAPETIDALIEIQSRRVVIAGGTAAVSQDVTDELTDLGLEVDRVGGADRYATAALAAADAEPGGTVYVASGEEFADALAVGPVSAVDDSPLLLTRATHLPQATRAALQDLDPERIVLVGGSARVSDEVLAELNSIAPTDRIGGTYRYETAALLADAHPQSGFTSTTAFVAPGHAWPDALTLSARAAAADAPILLVREQSIPVSTEAALSDLGATRAIIVGGTAVISDAVLAEVEAILSP